MEERHREGEREDCWSQSAAPSPPSVAAATVRVKGRERGQQKQSCCLSLTLERRRRRREPAVSCEQSISGQSSGMRPVWVTLGQSLHTSACCLSRIAQRDRQQPQTQVSRPELSASPMPLWTPWSIRLRICCIICVRVFVCECNWFLFTFASAFVCVKACVSQERQVKGLREDCYSNLKVNWSGLSPFRTKCEPMCWSEERKWEECKSFQLRRKTRWKHSRSCFSARFKCVGELWRVPMCANLVRTCFRSAFTVFPKACCEPLSQMCKRDAVSFPKKSTGNEMVKMLQVQTLIHQNTELSTFLHAK